LCGPISPATLRGNKYFLLLVNDLSRYMWVAVIPSNDRTTATIKDIHARVEGESGLKLKALRINRGGEFTATKFVDYCVAEGVHHQHTVSYNSQQNGIVERRNRAVVATARSMLKAKGLPRWFWGEAMNTATYVLNMCPMKSVHVTRDMVFDEQAQWDCGLCGDDGKSGGGDDVFTVEYTTMGAVVPMTDGADEAPTEESPLLARADDTEVDDDVDDENLDVDHDDDTSLRFRNMSDILVTPGFAPRALVTEELHVVSSDESTSFIEVEHSPSWRKAMMEEMDSIEENGIWSLVDLPPGRKPIGEKWVFKVKRDEHGAVSKHKARLVVKGYAASTTTKSLRRWLGWTRCACSSLLRRTRGGRCTIWTLNQRS
jgi:hypothetical protein